ncbi:hypothetical protein LLS1_22960 [Leifsonia sp. LS1]|uniref:hypothetical protein n=1 Tax=Leifsonia sp. LS1 TaxID=2828483 RepID=UPI001CFDB104|nr:hypothetical protein [Leifsonia sp. LS1]GIT80627.1 hypothetical protein LLS1_22960 [Leifsonia sp. LS1]
MDDPVEYLTTVVRVFPDYADSVIWFSPGPVAYEDAHISPELARDLQTWEDRYYMILDDHHEVREEFSAAFDADGLSLAGRLSDELGDAFAVEYLSTGGDRTTLRRDHPGSNPVAVAAFARMAERTRADHDRIVEAQRNGVVFRWVASHGTDDSIR